MTFLIVSFVMQLNHPLLNTTLLLPLRLHIFHLSWWWADILSYTMQFDAFSNWKQDLSCVCAAILGFAEFLRSTGLRRASAMWTKYYLVARWHSFEPFFQLRHCSSYLKLFSFCKRFINVHRTFCLRTQPHVIGPVDIKPDCSQTFRLRISSPASSLVWQREEYASANVREDSFGCHSL